MGRFVLRTSLQPTAVRYAAFNGEVFREPSLKAWRTQKRSSIPPPGFVTFAASIAAREEPASALAIFDSAWAKASVCSVEPQGIVFSDSLITTTPMDNAAKDYAERLIKELEHLNRTLNSFPKLFHGSGKNNDQAESKHDASQGKQLIPLHLRPSPERKNGPDQKWHRTFQWWKSRIEVAAFVSAMIYAFIAYRQWADANENFRSQQRAWVMVEKISIPHPFSPTEATEITFVAKNFGPSPALHFKARTDLSFSGHGCEVMLKARPPYDTESALAPSAVEQWANLQISNLSQNCLDALNAGYAQFKMTSTFTYDDIFGNSHSTGVCSQYEGMASRQLTTCQTGNYAK
ncbi:MAG TPA: hypothetical protein VK608_17825 [Edaphobacter sp.]|nr:hypothetical protein [Edaphobacter sp.]